MRLVVLGTTGDTGASLLDQALAHGHSDAIISCVGVSNPMQARKGTLVRVFLGGARAARGRTGCAISTWKQGGRRD